jgi:hypothetical protein
VTATDISPRAVEIARSLHPNVTFAVDDILASKLDGTFDYVFDRGCFHVLDPKGHPTFSETVARLTRRGGWLFLKCFSDEEPLRDFGPRRFSPCDLAKSWLGAFEVEAILSTVFHGSTARHPSALFGIFRRL